MPSKPKNNKGKHYHQSRKSKAIQRQNSTTAKRDVAAEIPMPVSDIDRPSPVKPNIDSAKVKTMQYPFIVNELRKIGILAGIILVILVILAIILS